MNKTRCKYTPLQLFGDTVFQLCANFCAINSTNMLTCSHFEMDEGSFVKLSVFEAPD